MTPDETREWWLNNRICDKIEEKLKAHEGYQLLRIDDTTGKTDVSLLERTTKANSWGAHFYLSVHHNAGVNGGRGGGVMAYTYTKVDDITMSWQKALYAEIIKFTGLSGDRATPIATANLHECRETNMPAVLLELGFMDSRTDVPIILTDDYANKCAEAIVQVIVKKGKLVKISNIKEDKVLYRVQVGAYHRKENAENMRNKLKADGYDAIIIQS